MYRVVMPNIITFLTFKDQAEQAARLYTSIFPDSRITQITHYPDLGPDFPHAPGSVMTVAFTLGGGAGREFVALNGGPEFEFGMGFSLSVQCDTQDEVDRYWNALLQDGGKPLACGWLIDRFGVHWQINPSILIETLSDPDREKAARAMKAMMGMVKIDAEQIRQAVP